MVFTETSLVFDLKSKMCLTFKINLREYIDKAVDKIAITHTLFYRSDKGKDYLLSHMKNILTQQAPLRDISLLFYKINRVYKQAGIERYYMTRLYTHVGETRGITRSV